MALCDEIASRIDAGELSKAARHLGPSSPPWAQIVGGFFLLPI